MGAPHTEGERESAHAHLHQMHFVRLNINIHKKKLFLSVAVAAAPALAARHTTIRIHWNAIRFGHIWSETSFRKRPIHVKLSAKRFSRKSILLLLSIVHVGHTAHTKSKHNVHCGLRTIWSRDK